MGWVAGARDELQMGWVVGDGGGQGTVLKYLRGRRRDELGHSGFKTS